MHKEHESKPCCLYKFRDFENKYHLKSVENSEFWFASPEEFNDPYDCNIPIRFDLCSKDWLYKQYLEFLSVDFPSLSLEEAKQKALKYADDPFRWKTQKKRIAANIGIFSLASYWNKFESQLMWSHYSKSHQGFVIGLSRRVLQDWVDDIANSDHSIRARFAQVKYRKEIPRLLPCEMDENEIVRKIITYKSQAWSYEEEIRLSIGKITVDDSLLSLSRKDRLQKLPPNVIQEITVGTNASSLNIDKIKNILKANGSKVKLYQATPNLDDFSFERLPIDY